jgi:hypothetical protein
VNKTLVYIYHIFCIHSLVVGQWGWFHNVDIVNSAVINMDVQVSSCKLTYTPSHLCPTVV